MKCCNKELKLQKYKDEYVYYKCPLCGKKGKGKDQKEAEKEFMMSKKTNPVTTKKNDDRPVTNISKELQPIPKDRNKIIEWSRSNMPALLNQSANFIDKPATQRMIEKNVRYVANLSGKQWDKIWSSVEGQESISDGLSEALYHGATLGDMGDLVPFGNSCEFIANIECYKNALETGKNAPFKNINITLVHENDQTSNEQKDGNFIFEIKRGIPRGEVIAVVVEAVRLDTNKNIGEIYDAERLMKKAEEHSPSYRAYLREKEEFLILKTSGKLGKDKAGRECIVKTGKFGEYYKYENDLKNPYDGADRPEMLRKSAGKSFFRPYMKTRNAIAMADEWTDEEIENEETLEKTADSVLNKAVNQFENIKDAEIVTDPDKTVKKKVDGKENLFDNEVDEL